MTTTNTITKKELEQRVELAREAIEEAKTMIPARFAQVHDRLAYALDQLPAPKIGEPEANKPKMEEPEGGKPKMEEPEDNKPKVGEAEDD